MSLSALRAACQRLHLRLHKRLVQECPLELGVCETCNRVSCTNERWLTCERRLASIRQTQLLDAAVDVANRTS